MGRKPPNDAPVLTFPGEDPSSPSPSNPLPIEPVAEERPSVVDRADTETVLAAIWDAAEVLPLKKQTRLKPAMMALVIQSGDRALIESWEARMGADANTPSREYTDYAAKDAAGALAEHGWDGFFARAQRRDAPFNVGRPEKMAAGVRLADSPAQARDLMALMFDLARPNISAGGGGDTFEQSDFGHVLSQLSMERCDLEQFERALALTAVPDSLRYAFWRARITGDTDTLASDIKQGANALDTSHVRQAIEGYEAVLTRGYCAE